MSTTPARLGLFGGTFNPIHLGHLRAAEEAAEALALERVVFLPSAVPPHKAGARGDAMLRVYDAETGQVIWTTELPAGSRGIPAMYEVNGRQYFVVNATAATEGGSRPIKSDTPRVKGYVAFALPERAK